MKRILVVDDETIVRESLRDWLEDAGHQVAVAESGEEALSLVEKEDFSIIVLDLKLPKMTGIDVLEKVKILKPKIKTVVITAYPTMLTKDEAARLGAIDYLIKPVLPESLDELIKETVVGMGDASVLKGFGLLKGLDGNEVAQMGELCDERAFKEGERIFSEGTRATHLHLCGSGKVDIAIWVGEPWNKDVTVHRAERGELFGWSAVVAPYTYTASAVAVEDGEEIRIKGSDLLELFNRSPHIASVVSMNLSTEISARLTQTRQKLSVEWLTSGTPSSSGPSPWGEPKRR